MGLAYSFIIMGSPLSWEHDGIQADVVLEGLRVLHLDLQAAGTETLDLV